MGEVYRAHDSRLGRDVAIKVLPGAIAPDPDRLRRFEQEARAAAALNHPNILAVHDVGSHEGAPYLVTELLAGQTLRQRLARGRLPARKAVDCALQIASGLAAAHEKGIVHRDLKPANLFVGSDGRLKILDFGLAKLIEPTPDSADRLSGLATRTEGTAPGTLVGTVGYMSPEQVSGKPVDHRSDIFSFGCVLYEMLSGRRAFGRDTAAETMTAILKEEPPEITDSKLGISPSLERILRHCLEKDPAQRFQSARDLVFDLEAVAGASGAATGAAPADGGRTKRRAAYAALGLLALAVAFLAGRSGSDSPWRSQAPTIRQLTFGRGTIRAARFAPDGQTIVFGAAWDGQPVRLFLTRLDSDEPTPIKAPDADVLSVSTSGQMAISVGHRFDMLYLGQGALARMPLLGGTPRALLEGVAYADWAPEGGELAVVRRTWARDVLEFPIGTTLHETGGWISSPRFSRDGTRIAFLDHRIVGATSGSITVVDRAGRRTDLGARGSRGLAWSRRGDEVWFYAHAREGHALRAVDGAGRERTLLPLLSQAILLDVSQEGRVLIATEEVRREVHVLAPGQDRPRNQGLLDVPVARHISADGRTVVMTANTNRGPQVFLARTDGSPPIHLGGPGEAAGLSPDGAWVVAIRQGTPSRVLLLPTGAGESRTLPTEPLTVDAAKFLPNGKQLVLAAREPGRGTRFFLLDLAGGPPRPFGPEGIQRVLLHWLPVSPDGTLVAAYSPTGTSALYPVDGGAPREVTGLGDDRVILGWTSDARGLFVTQRMWPQTRIERFDLATGRLERWTELEIADPTGIVAAHVNLSADGRSYAWTVSRVLGNLFVVEGLR